MWVGKGRIGEVRKGNHQNKTRTVKKNMHPHTGCLNPETDCMVRQPHRASKLLVHAQMKSKQRSASALPFQFSFLTVAAISEDFLS